jgi:hypothetical protein
MANNCNNKPTVKGTNILLLLKYNMYVNQGCTNPGHQLTVETKFCMVASNISLSSVWTMLPSGTQNFEVAPTLLENPCTLDVFCVLVTENIHI